MPIRQLRPGQSVLSLSDNARAALAEDFNAEVERGRRAAIRNEEFGRFANFGGVRSTLTGADTTAINTTQFQAYGELDPRNTPGLDDDVLGYRTLYEPLYNIRQNAGFPQVFNIQIGGPAGVVFKQIHPTGEIEFGTVGEGSRTVTIQTWGGGYEISEDFLEYGQTWVLDELAESLGRADVLVRNDIHFSPIINATYAGARNIAYDATAGATAAERDVNTLTAAIQALPKGRWLLCNIGLYFRLRRALATTYADLSTPNAIRDFIDAGRVIFYEGGSVTVGQKTYTYSGVGSNVAFLVVPRQNFGSYVKHYMRVTTHEGDMSRLIDRQIIARERLGVFADVSGDLGAVKVNFA